MLNLLLILLLACTAACSPSDKREDKEKRLLPISLSAEVRSLDPSIGIDDASQITIRMLFEGLMSVSLEGKLIPAVAERYEVSRDQKSYTFFLRNSVWSNGDPVTAHDFEYSWKRVVSGNNKGAAVHNFYPIKNVEEIVKGKKSIEEMGVKARDEKTLIVHLEHPTPYFLEVVATSTFFPVNAELDKRSPNWFNAVGSAFVCNGPFVLHKHKQNNEIVVLKNLRYWDQQHVHLPGIKIAIVSNTLTQLQMFEKNELAWVGKPLSKIPLDAVPTLKKKSKLTFIPSMGLYWYFLNTEVFPFNNKKMRQAFAYAINRKAITDHVLQEGETPALGILPKSLNVNSVGYFADNQVELARKLFTEALQELGITKEQLPPLTLSCNMGEYHQRISQVVQEQWQNAFGIRIHLQHEEWKVHYQNLVRGNFQIGGMGWHSWLRDPIYMMQTFRFRSDGVNMSRWENSQYQALLDATDQETNPEKRRALFYEAEQLLMEEMPVIPMYFNSIAYAKKPGLSDVYVSELNQLDFKWAQYEPEKKR